MLRVEIVFSALTTVFLLYRILVDRLAHDRAWIVLPPVVVGLILLVVLYPRAAAD
jgi:ABC-type molybdate transport system permease subunit